MKRAVIILIILSFAGLQLFSCASMTNTEKGTTAGAVTGGILGGILGDTKGAIIGAFAGAIVGAVVGNYYDKQTASREEAAKRYKYKGKGTKLEIENSSVVPQDATAGSAVEAHVQYTLLAPAETKQIKVTETRILAYGNEKLKLDKREVARTQGTYTSTMKFTMPKDIEKGNYTLITQISDGKRTKTAKSFFKVV